MRKVDAFVKSELYAFDCGAAGGGQIVIAPDGHVGICHGYLGSRKHFVTTVDDEAFDPQNDPVFMEWSRRSPLSMDVCRECPALGICGGGCPLNADFEEGSIWGLDKRFCVHCKTTLEWLIWDLYKQMTNKTDGVTERTAP
ncbi:SPASM domain-containing protein [Patescibacteria group bacterium]|nr:SPASM domain-containing protein [Patescibacteria group bacterium]